MSSEIALYRKYRPTSFAEVEGQDHVIEVLEAAIQKNTIPHATLFTGPRGTGKTTLARIFARTLGVHDEDMYEIDAASYNSVDDVRQLNEAVMAMPYSSPYKVYILDEVHMFSKAAWNAFLKTLEEPPKHVLFMLATTEFDKVIDTVVSRCQVCTLRSPSRMSIRALLMSVAEKEKIMLDESGADMIAVSANGSYRDALSILQGVLLIAEDGVVPTEKIARMLGVPPVDTIMQLLDAFEAQDVQAALGALPSSEAEGANATLLLTLLIERVRAIMLYRNTKDEVYITHYGDEEKEKLRRFATTARNIHSRVLMRLLEAENVHGSFSVPLLPLELACIDICEFTS